MTKVLQLLNKSKFLILLLLLHLFLLSNLLFTAWPEVILWPYLMLKGWLPYKDIAIVHTPLLLIDLSVFYKILGVGVAQLKIYTWFLVLFTDLVLFWVVQKIWSTKTALLSVFFYIIWQPFYGGNGLWFDLSLAPLALILFFLTKKKDYFWLGVFFVLAYFYKQTAVWFSIPVLFTLFVKERSKIVKNLKQLLKGVAVVSLVAVFLIIIFRIFNDFYFWTIKFGIFELPKAAGQVQFPNVRQLIYAIIPFCAYLAYLYKEKDKNLLGLWILAGLLGVYPRWELFHFQPAIPFLAIVSALILLKIDKYAYFLKLGLFLYLLASVYLLLGFYMSNYKKEVRFYDDSVKEVAAYVKKNTKTNDQIFVFNYWDSIYTFSDTLPATRPWIPHLSWYMELPGVQEKMVEDLEVNNPSLVVMHPVTGEGLSSYRPRILYDFISANYGEEDKIGEVVLLKKRFK